MVPAGLRQMELLVTIPRLKCQTCGAIRQPHLPFADPKKHYTHALERYVIDLCQAASLQEVARRTGLSWDTIKSIHKSWLGRRYRKISLKKVRYLGIDELYLGRKSKYITLVTDLESGQILHIGQGKGQEALVGFWGRVRRSRAVIAAVATDMASGFMTSVLKELPQAKLVLDHFHLVKWFNDKLTSLRRDLYREADTMGKAVLKGSRWLLLKAPENLKSHVDSAKDERRRLQEALQLNQPLATAYYMKERLRLLFDAITAPLAEQELKRWISQAQTSGIRILLDAAKQLQLWKPFLLNWYDHPISTSKVEVNNRKIGLLQRMAHGYRDQEYFYLRIHHIHNQNYSLTG